MTMTSLPVTRESKEDLASRFARETEPYFDVLSRGARRLTRNNADADDLLQDTLLYAFAGFHTFREGSNLKAWLFRILHNRWVSTFRARQRRPLEVSADIIGQVCEQDFVAGRARGSAWHRSAEAEVVDDMPGTEVAAALATLPEGFRTAVYLVDVEGYTFAETAALMSVPMGTVMSRVSRGRRRLCMALAHLAPDKDGAAVQTSVA